MFFGRSCLILILDILVKQQLVFWIDNYNHILYLIRKLLNYDHQRFYSYWDKSNDVTKLPKKKGSFQLFLKGYINADIWLKIYPIPTNDVCLLKKTSRIEVL